MTAPFPTSRSHSRARAAAVVVAATTVPVMLAVPLLRAESSVPSELGLRPAAPVAVLPGAEGSLAFSSYLGGQEWDETSGIAVDRDGNSHVAGFTLSEDFPVAGPGSRGHAAIVDALVTTVEPGTGRIRWSTQLGGVDLDAATAITVDDAGNSYVVGRTGSEDFPTVRALQDGLAGRACTGRPCHDAFIAKLSPTGAIVWSTYFGGTRNEEALGVAVDEDSNVYVTGVTDSSDLPVRSAFQARFQSPPCRGDLPCPYDAFVTKIAASGGRVEYSTYLGGNASDFARGIDVDQNGNAYVAGSTGSTDFPRVRALQDTLRGERCGPPPGEPCRQAFLTKLKPDGSTAAYSTFLGGREHDDAYGVAVDASRRAHVTGATQSADFPIRHPLPGQGSLQNEACTSEQPAELCDDGFVAKLQRNGQALRYSTYLGGRAEDQGLSIDVAKDGQALVAGRTDSADFPTAEAAQPAFGGYIDGFATRIRRDGGLVWSTFLGGSDADRSTGVVADRTGATHLTGRTLSPDFPTVRPFQGTLQDEDYDTFVSVLK